MTATERLAALETAWHRNHAAAMRAREEHATAKSRLVRLLAGEKYRECRARADELRNELASARLAVEAQEGT